MKKREQRKWKIKDIGKFLVNCLKSLVKGDLLIKLNPDRYIPQIVLTFTLLALTILFGLGVDGTMVKVERNKVVLQDLEILHTQKSYELQKLNRRSTVDKMLQDMGSTITEPSQPATQK